MTAKKQKGTSKKDLTEAERVITEAKPDTALEKSSLPAGSESGESDEKEIPAIDPLEDDLTDPEDLIEDEEGDTETEELLEESAAKRALKAQMASQWRDREPSPRKAR
jgi:hypothetical protein